MPAPPVQTPAAPPANTRLGGTSRPRTSAGTWIDKSKEAAMVSGTDSMFKLMLGTMDTTDDLHTPDISELKDFTFSQSSNDNSAPGPGVKQEDLIGAMVPDSATGRANGLHTFLDLSPNAPNDYILNEMDGQIIRDVLLGSASNGVTLNQACHVTSTMAIESPSAPSSSVLQHHSLPAAPIFTSQETSIKLPEPIERNIDDILQLGNTSGGNNFLAMDSNDLDFSVFLNDSSDCDGELDYDMLMEAIKESDVAGEFDDDTKINITECENSLWPELDSLQTEPFNQVSSVFTQPFTPVQSNTVQTNDQPSSIDQVIQSLNTIQIPSPNLQHINLENITFQVLPTHNSQTVSSQPIQFSSNALQATPVAPVHFTPVTPVKVKRIKNEVTPEATPGTSRPRRQSKKPLRFEVDEEEDDMDVDPAYDPIPSTSTAPSTRRQREPTENLTEKEKYHRIRLLNNEASKRCRQKRKVRMKDLEADEKTLSKRNEELQKKYEALKRQRDIMNKMIKHLIEQAKK